MNIRLPSLLIIFFSYIFLGLTSPSEIYVEHNHDIDNLKSNLNNAYYLDVSDKVLNDVLNNSKDRVSLLFQIPDPLKKSVLFWLKIYTKYSLFHTIIYDKIHPEVIYDVIDNTDLFRSGKSPIVIEILTKKRVNNKLNEIKKLLANKNKLKPTTELKKIIYQNRKICQINNIRYQLGQRNQVLEGLQNSINFILPMEQIFSQYSIPIEITRIPLVESSFVIKSYSKASAVGVWQFLKRSAEEYLIVNPNNGIDERFSPIKSTIAAAKMFKRNFYLLKDWPLAIIAYNHGAKNLLPLRKRYSSNNISSLLLKNSNTPLGYASRNYYSEFLAMLYAEKYKDYFFSFDEKHTAYNISIIKLNKPMSIFDLATELNISIHELKTFNPDIFVMNKKLPSGTRVVLPHKSKSGVVTTNKNFRKVSSIFDNY